VKSLPQPLAGVITPVDALRLVRVRGLEMAKAATASPSGMSAVLGGDREVVLARQFLMQA
jgi:[acyl-carrier-protein] S-malonyltransferase